MPQIGLERLLDRIASNKPVPAVVLLGDDSYLRAVCRDKIIGAAIPQDAHDWALTRLSAEKSWNEVFRRAQTLPMLGPLQVLIVEDTESLEELPEKGREAALDLLDAYLADPAPFTVLLLEASKLDERYRLFKMLNQKSLIVRVDIADLDATALAAQMSRELDTELDCDAAAMLVDIVDHKPSRIRVELEKLALYAAGRGRITREDVEALVVSAKTYSVWQLADMLAARQRDSAMRFLDSLLRDGEQPAGIVGALAWMYRKLLEASELPEHTSHYQAARYLATRLETAELALRGARRISRASLLAGISALAEADSDLKSGIATPRAVMEFLVARLTAAGTHTAA